MRSTIPVTAIISVKNEERAIAKCVDSLRRCDEIVVVDSISTDRTVEIARRLGATVVHFDWNGRYPKKKQWCLDNVETKNDWVLFVDGDERATDQFVDEIADAITAPGFDAFDIGLHYYFGGRRLRFGHQVSKRALVRKGRVEFPVVDDLDAPGMGELEGHYQPRAEGQVGRISERMIHDDPDPISSWVDRHNKYSDWESYLAVKADRGGHATSARTAQGRAFRKLPAKALIFFLYSYVVRGGFLDGRAGFDYAFAHAFYYWLTGAKIRELRRQEHGTTPA